MHEITVGKKAQNPVIFFQTQDTMGMSCTKKEEVEKEREKQIEKEVEASIVDKHQPGQDLEKEREKEKMRRLENEKAKNKEKNGENKASIVRTSALAQAFKNEDFEGDLFCAIGEGKGKAAFFTSAVTWQSSKDNRDGQLEKADNVKLLLNIFAAAGF